MSAPPGLDLQALLAVQDLDVELDRCRHRHATLPERAVVAGLDEQLARLGAREASVRAELDMVASREEGLERTLAAVEERASTIRKRLYGGTVSATRELQAMAAEVESLEHRASDLESEALELLEQREPFDATLAVLTTERRGLEEERADAAAALASREHEIDAATASLQERRAQAATSVPDDLAATYERLRSRLGGIGVARLVGSRCDGCHLTVANSFLEELRHQGPGVLSFCEQCGRILVPAAH